MSLVLQRWRSRPKARVQWRSHATELLDHLQQLDPFDYLEGFHYQDNLFIIREVWATEESLIIGFTRIVRSGR
jgi:hypothetical protein